MPVLNLPGIRKEEPDQSFCRSVSAASELVKNGVVALLVGQNGAIDFYRDDNNKYRCNYHRFSVTVESEIYNTKKDAVKWLKEHITKIW